MLALVLSRRRVVGIRSRVVADVSSDLKSSSSASVGVIGGPGRDSQVQRGANQLRGSGRKRGRSAIQHNSRVVLTRPQCDLNEFIATLIRSTGCNVRGATSRYLLHRCTPFVLSPAYYGWSRFLARLPGVDGWLMGISDGQHHVPQNEPDVKFSDDLIFKIDCGETTWRVTYPLDSILDAEHQLPLHRKLDRVGKNRVSCCTPSALSLDLTRRYTPMSVDRPVNI